MNMGPQCWESVRLWVQAVGLECLVHYITDLMPGIGLPAVEAWSSPFFQSSVQKPLFLSASYIFYIYSLIKRTYNNDGYGLINGTSSARRNMQILLPFIGNMQVLLPKPSLPTLSSTLQLNFLTKTLHSKLQFRAPHTRITSSRSSWNHMGVSKNQGPNTKPQILRLLSEGHP